MIETLTWWVMLEVLGLAATPIIFLIARRLPGRGYALGKILGILLLGYIVWITGILHLMAFTQGSAFVALLLITAFSGWLLLRDGGGLLAELRQFVREQRILIIVTEVVFAVAFLGWAFYRAHDPQVTNTEKYMDFGILNAILNSDYFPPQDQWMSGFTINYYYFGYLITAALTKLSGVTPNITFNLANALYFALGAVGSFGILWELVALRRRSAGQLAAQGRQKVAPYIVGILGALMIMCAGNLLTVKALADANSCSNQAQCGDATDANILRGVTSMAAMWDKMWNQQLYGNVGWDSSRVVKDTMNGQPNGVDPIDEFPAFSYVLADLHPHVMALPLTMLALFLAFVLLVSGYGAKSLLSGDLHARVTLGVLAISIGGLFMANTWDFPTYLLIAALAMLINSRRLAKGALRLVAAPVVAPAPLATAAASTAVDEPPTPNTSLPVRARPAATIEQDAPAQYVPTEDVVEEDEVEADEEEAETTWWQRLYARPVVSWLLQVVALAVISLLLYIPYILTYKAPFGSGLPAAVMNDPTVNGLVNLPIIRTLLNYIAPNVWDKGWEGFALMFAVSLYATLIFLVAQAWKAYQANEVKIGAYVTVGIIVVSLLLAFLLKFPLLVLLPPMIALVFYALQRLPRLNDADTMTLLLVGVGALIALGTELFFLRDVFDNRQNTIFKFYFQIWLIWNLAAIYAGWWILSRALGWLRERRDEITRPAISAAGFVWSAGFALLILASLLYLPAAMREKGIFYGSVGANGQAVNQPLTLDGWADFGKSNADDYAAMNWMRQNVVPNATIAEGSPDVEYQIQGDAGRVSAYTGIQAVVAWSGHEYQWHNGDSKVTPVIGQRVTDVKNIFTGTSDQVKRMVDKYQVDYIFVGKVEQQEMQGAGQTGDKFAQLGYTQVYSKGSASIYATPYASGPLGPKADQVVAGQQ